MGREVTNQAEHTGRRAHRRALVGILVLLAAAALALAYGKPYGSGNQLTYLLDPLRRAFPELFTRDWLLSSTTTYHPLFGWLTAPLFRLDPDGATAFAVAQLVVMIATFIVLYRQVTTLARRSQLACFLLLLGVLALGGGRAIAGTYLYAGYLQPSSLATLAWLAAMLAWVRDRPVATGLWLGLGGACHINFLLLGIGLFSLLELSSRRLVMRRWLALLGPSFVVLAAFTPSLLASAHADDPGTALRVLVEFSAPGHYDPRRFGRWIWPLLAWLVLAWGLRPPAPAERSEACERWWRFAVTATALCAAATELALVPPLLGITRLFVWRIAPFAQLASQLIVLSAALAPSAVRAPRSAARSFAIGLGVAVLLIEAVHLTADHRNVIALGLATLAGLAARWVAPRWSPGRVIALGLALATFGYALADRRKELVERTLFEADCRGSDCGLLRWIATETPVDAVILAPPYMNWFRLFARRAMVADTKSPPLYADELVAWYRRLCAMVDAPEMATHEAVEARWDTLTAEQVLAVARRFDVDYVVIAKELTATRLTAPVAFENPWHVLYRLR